MEEILVKYALEHLSQMAGGVLLGLLIAKYVFMKPIQAERDQLKADNKALLDTINGFVADYRQQNTDRAEAANQLLAQHKRKPRQ